MISCSPSKPAQGCSSFGKLRWGRQNPSQEIAERSGAIAAVRRDVNKKGRRCPFYDRSSTAAMPWPTPTHIVTSA